MESIMAAAKALPEKKVIEHLEMALKMYRNEPTERNTSQLNLYCMIFSFQCSTKDMNMSQAIRLVEDARKQTDFFHPNSKPN